MNLEIKKQFRKESGKDVIVWAVDNSAWAYTEDYVNWLEKKLQTSNATDQKEIKEGDVMEVTQRLYGHEFKIGETVTVRTVNVPNEEYECLNGKGDFWFLDAEELLHIKTETK